MEESRKGEHGNGQAPPNSSEGTLRPFSNDPGYRGLYVVTTYKPFFEPLPSEKEKNTKRAK